MVQPYLICCSSVVSLLAERHSQPCLRKPSNLRVEFALKTGMLATMSFWTCNDLPSLAQRRLHTRLCYVCKIVHGLLYFPPGVLYLAALYPTILVHIYYINHLHILIHICIPLYLTLFQIGIRYQIIVISSPSFTSFKYNLSLFTL